MDEQPESIAGIILAAGGSTRYSGPKLLLDWLGTPVVTVVAETALKSGLSPVIVVLGAYKEELKLVLSGKNVLLVENPSWETGQSTSIVTGIRSLPAESSAAIFLLGDQPQVNPEIIKAEISLFIQTRTDVIIPRIGGRRANPVLFSRKTFASLDTLQGDTGGRAVFSQFECTYIEWEEPSLLLDIDTPEDYAKLLDLEKRKNRA